RLGLNLDLGDPKGDEAAQLLSALGDCSKPGEGKTGVEGRERLLLLVVAIVIAADDKKGGTALHRLCRFQIGIVSACHCMVVVGPKLALPQPQPDEAVIGAVGDSARQLADGRGIVLRLKFYLGCAP